MALLGALLIPGTFTTLESLNFSRIGALHPPSKLTFLQGLYKSSLPDCPFHSPLS